jgi:hypothetical protein
VGLGPLQQQYTSITFYPPPLAPAVETLGTTDVETRPKFLKHRRGKVLGEDVGKLRVVKT